MLSLLRARLATPAVATGARVSALAASSSSSSSSTVMAGVTATATVGARRWVTRARANDRRPRHFFQPTKLSRPKARDVRFLFRTLPAPITGPVAHLRETPLESWVHTLKGERVGVVSLEREVFGAPLRVDIMNDVVRWQLAARRQGTAKGKNRTEVAGSNSKKRQQKGSGSARQGDGRAPHFRGGGAVFPPQPRSYDYNYPKGLRRKGVQIALSSKYAEENLFVIDSVEVPSHKSKDVIRDFLSKWPQYKEGKRIHIIHADLEMDPNFALATRSSENVSFLPVKSANAFDIVKSDVVFVTERAVTELNAKLIRSNAANRAVMVTPPLYLMPRVGVDPVATANRVDFIASLTDRERERHGNELIKVGENKSVAFVPLTEAERAAAQKEAEAAPRRTFRQIVPGPSGGIILADVKEKARVPVSKRVIVDGQPLRTTNRDIYREFAAYRAARVAGQTADYENWLAYARSKMLSRSTLQPPTHTPIGAAAAAAAAAEKAAAKKAAAAAKA